MGNLLKIHSDYNDFKPVILGRENCSPCHKCGPYIREFYLIHFVLDGKGTFTNQNGTYEVSKGQAFLIRPGEVTTYVADEKTPWTYAWVHFKGALSAKFDDVPDVFDFEKSFINDFLIAFDIEDNVEIYVTGMLFILYSKLLSPSTNSNYPSKTKQYIDINYMNDMTVDGIANMLCINRKYLSRIFKARYGKTIQQYIVEKRLTEAQKLLTLGYGVEQSAHMVGYRDSFNFSKSFKKLYGKSPSDYKKNS